MENKSIFDKIGHWFRHSTTLKVFIIGLLALVLLIPSAMVTDLIRERQDLRNEAVKEVAGKWGAAQTIGGPVVSVPYEKWIETNGKKEAVAGYAHFLPSQLTIRGKLEPESRHRGIFVVMLYRGLLEFSGSFDKLSVDNLNVGPSNLRFDKAVVSVGITDLKGINRMVQLRWNEASLDLEPGLPAADLFASGVSIPVAIKPGEGNYTFSFRLDVNGSESIRFAPFGKNTKVHLESAWGNPSFMGSFLPKNHTISEKGFVADWNTLHLNRNYPQQGLDNFMGNPPRDNDDAYQKRDDADQLSSFGVRLYLPVDDYQQTNRSAKYAAMFVLLTFLTFFFVEILNKRRIHPIQYLLIGFAIVLFYVLLLSLSEHIAFAKAYWAACTLIVSLVSYYAWNILKNKRLTAFVAVVFVLLYGFFYALLRLEDYALLAGSFGLLLILATIMHITRRLNWYQLSNGEEAGGE